MAKGAATGCGLEELSSFITKGFSAPPMMRPNESGPVKKTLSDEAKNTDPHFPEKLRKY